jgi:Xaa-Pro aminopeptidase
MTRWILLVLLTATAAGQPLQLDMSVFAQRRATFISRMEPRSAAIFAAAPEYVRNLDVEYEYRQESNFYYLSGFEEPESILLLVRSPENVKYILFVQKRDPRSEAYEGPRSGVEGAIAFYKADTAFTVDEFERLIYRFVPHDAMVYYTFGINSRVDDKVKRLFIQRRSAGDWPISDPAPLVAEMRVIKNKGDFQMGLERAIDISAQAHQEAIRSIHPGMYEYEVQAIFEYVYRKNGSPRNAYPCIVGSGPNSSVLHYSTNIRRMNDGDVVVMDCGAEYGYYAADITRTVPVNGAFSREQRALYQLVLDAQNTAMNAVRPGLVKSALDTIINNVLGKGLLQLGLIKDARDFRLYTRHGYSHWLGLDVHDVGSYTADGASRRLEPGMVFTLEPGVYVSPGIYDAMKHGGYTEDDVTQLRPVVDRYMNIAIRIEDNVLVTQGGFRNLSASAPREVDAIEHLMKEQGMTEGK